MPVADWNSGGRMVSLVLWRRRLLHIRIIRLMMMLLMMIPIHASIVGTLILIRGHRTLFDIVVGGDRLLRLRLQLLLLLLLLFLMIVWIGWRVVETRLSYRAICRYLTVMSGRCMTIGQMTNAHLASNCGVTVHRAMSNRTMTVWFFEWMLVRTRIWMRLWTISAEIVGIWASVSLIELGTV